MRNITRASIALIGAVALTGATALSASAEPISDGGAPVTVAVDGGEIVLGAPSALALTAAAPNAPATGVLGTMTVTDTTASTTDWTVQVTVSDFVSTVNATVVDTIPAAAFTYSPNVATVAGVATVVPGADSIGGNLSTAQSATAVHGNNTASWTADVTLLIPSAALAGDYTGTVTHSLL
jgi:hypothetical protein